MFSISVLSFAQTGKEEYDTIVKAEEEVTCATGNLFQGLRADLEGFVSSLKVKVIIDPLNRTGSTRVFIVSVKCLLFSGKFNFAGPLNGANNWYRRTYGHAVHSYSRA